MSKANLQVLLNNHVKTKVEQAGLAQSLPGPNSPYKTGITILLRDKSEQAGLAQSLLCPKHPTRLVNNPVKTIVNRLGTLSPFHVQSTLQDW